ncbi:MAG: hypothetical protein M1818_000366 [Claussenomyces sp. TS43310]|nr:MAG: hypothetical protein M1818_000366 [Claussenomyces sp. TS43310]
MPFLRSLLFVFAIFGFFLSLTATADSSLSYEPDGYSPAASLTVGGQSALDPATNVFLQARSTFNSSVAPGELPIDPRLTPGFAVAGVILLISGSIYALIGLKNRMLHIALSSAYLASLSITVLILYVMNPPVSNAVQGAYVVAIVMTGLILGALAIVFKEMTEGLGCLLGGFSFAMWLLVLVPGGLLTTTSSIAIFIACFTVAGYATSFSHYTRSYGLIGGISFAGATVVVLGIDCFSKAGLKEFWAYIWNLNQNLFPLGATTYPITRGIRVEIAAIMIIFLASIMSQIRLWKVIKDRRARRAEEDLQNARNIDQEEENVGSRVERQNALDRQEWEAVYGDKDAETTLQDAGSSRKEATSSVKSAPDSSNDGIEMSPVADRSSMDGAGLMAKSNGASGDVIVRVLADDDAEQKFEGHDAGNEGNSLDQNNDSEQTEQIATEEKVWFTGPDVEASSIHSAPRAAQTSKDGVRTPEVVPLPFKVPDSDTQSNRSSVATYNDDNFRRHSKRFSAGSLLRRSLSRQSRNFSHRLSMPESVSTEQLIVPHDVQDDRSSIAATLDDLSDNEDLHSQAESQYAEDVCTEKTEHNSLEGQATTDNAGSTVVADQSLNVESSDEKSSHVHETIPVEEKHTTDEPDEKQLDCPELEDREAPCQTERVETVEEPSLTPSSDPPAAQQEERGLSTKPLPQMDHNESIQRSRTTAPNLRVKPEPIEAITLTEKSLPPAMSKVGMSYRTNEWAKHLADAEAPALEELHIAKPTARLETRETPAPLNITELQQTAENAPVAPAMRSISAMSSNSPTQLNQANSYQSSTTVIPEAANSLHREIDLPRSISQTSARSQHQQAPGSRANRKSAAPTVSVVPTLVESPVEEQSSTFPTSSPTHASTMVGGSPSSTHLPSTLIGQRESIIRSKSSFGFHPLAPTPELGTASVPSNSSISGASSINDPYLTEADDNMTMAARRSLMRQSSMPIMASSASPLSQSLSPKRQSTLPPEQRASQLASWRASVQADLRASVVPIQSVERRRSQMLAVRADDERSRQQEESRRTEMERERDRKMRMRMSRASGVSGGSGKNRGDMLEAHREAMRKLQRGVRLEGL